MQHDEERTKLEVAEAVIVEQRNALAFARKFSVVSTVAASLLLAYAAGSTVTTFMLSTAMRDDIARIKEEGSKLTQKNTTDIALLQQELRGITPKLDRIEKAGKDQYDDLKGILQDHMRQQSKGAAVTSSLPSYGFQSTLGSLMKGG